MRRGPTAVVTNTATIVTRPITRAVTVNEGGEGEEKNKGGDDEGRGGHHYLVIRRSDKNGLKLTNSNDNMPFRSVYNRMKPFSFDNTTEILTYAHDND
jgi:hypothetical protein